MPTPNGVNYLLQSLLLLSNSPIIEQQESKVDVQSYVLISLSLHTHTPLVITHYFLEAAVRTESDANLQISVDFDAGFGRNMTEEVANWQFFCCRCLKMVGLLRKRNQKFDHCVMDWGLSNSCYLVFTSTKSSVNCCI